MSRLEVERSWGWLRLLLLCEHLSTLRHSIEETGLRLNWCRSLRRGVTYSLREDGLGNKGRGRCLLEILKIISGIHEIIESIIRL
jgi:hypothetical protein